MFWPLQYIVPASDWTPEYGVIAYPNRKIINAQPGVFYNIYTTNALRYRGPLVDPESPGHKIVLLGDSNIFGFGVDDHETISAQMNKLYGDGATVINLGNGGWSLPQEVRRYIELGQLFKPEAVVLYMAPNDLACGVYGITWVAYANEGEIELRDCPKNPAGRLRKLLPPDSLLYSILMRSQIMMRIKPLLNRNAMRVHTHPDGTAEPVGPDPHPRQAVPSGRVIIRRNRKENERRYITLLDAFARLLNRQGVRLVFLTNDETFYGAADLSEHAQRLEAEGLLEHHAISQWFVPGRDYPISRQGHNFGPEATAALARHLHDLLRSPGGRGIRRGTGIGEPNHPSPERAHATIATACIDLARWDRVEIRKRHWPRDPHRPSLAPSRPVLRHRDRRCDCDRWRRVSW